MMESNEERARRAFEIAMKVRDYEIDKFWQRSAFFWVFVSLTFAGFGFIYDKRSILSALLAAGGFIASLVWTFQNRGSKYWYEAWEQKVQRLECLALGFVIFGRVEREKTHPIWAGDRFSVSRLVIALSDFVTLIWIGLFVLAASRASDDVQHVFAALIAVLTASFAILVYVNTYAPVKDAETTENGD